MAFARGVGSLPREVQGDAGVGLRHAAALRGQRDALRLVDLDEHAEPVEVELGHGFYFKTIWWVWRIVAGRNRARRT
jgi:hypothetical protein